ncbi:MAG TPA: ATP-binding protein, partial [Terriglobales bacterium]|nr:ATP-binding protein [Terriglobales bacterium]
MSTSAEMRVLSPSHPRPWYLRYGAAVVFSAAALTITVALAPFRPSAETPVFLLAVALAAWFGGAGPALLATLLTGVSLDYFVFGPRYGWSYRLQDFIGLGWSVFCSLVMAHMANRRSRALEELQASEALLRQFVEYTPLPIAMLDHQLHYLAVSRSWYGAYRIAEQSIVGKRTDEVLPAMPAAWKTALPRCLAGAVERGAEDEMRWRDGSVDFVRWEMQPWRRAEGSIGGVILFSEIITERKRAEQSLRQAEKLAAAGRLAASVAHEINNPLEAVTNLLYLARTAPKHEAQSYLDQADAELQRITHIAQQTLGFYRDTGRPKLVNVSDVAEDVLRLYQAKLNSRRITIDRRLAPATVIVLAGELRQVLSNTIANAIDAMPRGGRLVMKVAERRYGNPAGCAGIRITVADTGCGIHASDRQKVFEPFWTTKEDVGTGLGLWVTR